MNLNRSAVGQWLTALTLLVLLASIASTAAVASVNQPNVVLIVVDDLDSGSLWKMPNIDALLRRQGTDFSNFFVSTPSCCPSRASILRGQYSHNHGVLRNFAPNGGFHTFRDRGNEESTVATWLQDAGYQTGLFGKYLNEYELDPAHVPPGWNEWHASAGLRKYFSYRLNKNGVLVDYGEAAEDYETDVLADAATTFIEQAAAGGRPFFAFIAPPAPHEPNTPAPRHEAAFADAEAPRPPSFNEADVSDKPEWVREVPPLTSEEMEEIDLLYRQRLRSMLAVDDMVGKLIEAMSDAGVLEETYILFTSDNGFHFGEHRLGEGKGTPYLEAIRVPLIVRGPGVAAGRVEERLALNNDLAPTLAELAEAEVPEFVDGRSLLPLLQGNKDVVWRRAVLVEYISRDPPESAVKLSWRAAQTPSDASKGVTWQHPRTPAFRVLISADIVYVEYKKREFELYDRRSDPSQMNNLAPTAERKLLNQLSRYLDELRDCAADGCRAAENAALNLRR